MTSTIAISDILIEDRIRIDHSNTDGLKESLSLHGTIQPIVLEAMAEGGYRLIAGGRRLTFLKELGHTQLWHGSTYVPERPGYVLGVELPKDTLHELELEENIRRKAMSWQERALAIAEIHRLKIIRTGSKWGYRETGEMFGISLGKVDYSIAMARLLKSSPSHPLWQIESPTDGVRWMLEAKENEMLAEKARRMAVTPAPSEGTNYLEALTGTPEPINILTMDEAKEDARIQYLSNPLNPPDQFDAYYEQKKDLNRSRLVVPITSRLQIGSCLDHMDALAGRFDHIITDPPYAIDMVNLEQSNLGMANIESVAAEHDVNQNTNLLTKFIYRAYTNMKESGFLIMWADYSMWDFICTTATDAGFKVQRWPVIWVKTHRCMNSAASYNFTKTTEIAIVCRKGNAILTQTGPLGHIIAGHDEYKDMMSHPFVKPFECWRHLVEACTLKGQTIYEPFAGEGSAVLSFIRLERNYLASELTPHHYNRLLENVKNEYLRMNLNCTFT